MLSRRCRRFRARFSPAEPGVGRAHRERCADCHAYASTLERIAATKLPLPETLRRNLSEIPGAFVSRPLPSAPLPPALRRRLQGIARPGGLPLPAKPPIWLVQPRYAIAASLLLTVLSTALLGNPGHLEVRAANFVGRELTHLTGRLLPASPNENRGASEAPGRERRKP
jgi:hypothetical protein